ncbi:MAG: TatD family hydrolase [Acidimicrobiia bacterium]
MLAGLKGRSVVERIPQNRVLLETDGPFAQVRRTSLQPWDISLAQHAIAQMWGVDEENVIHRF